MPELPAEKNTSSPDAASKKSIERLATAEELAEFGAVAPDPEVEAQILALLEAQMEEAVPQELFTTTTMEFASMKISPAKISMMETAKGSELPSEGNKLEIPAAGLPTVPTAAPILPLAAENWEALKSPPVADEKQPVEAAPAPLHEAWPADLLEFAQTLDQHRLWIETGGKEGVRGDLSGLNLAGSDLTGVNLQGAQMNKTVLRGADLSMANLRGASLVETDLRDANLLGAEFSGASLMGANLYGAQGLWAGRLGGTNLFDATLPEALAVHDGGKTIAQSTLSARRFYGVVIGLCVAAWGLIALTSDVRLLLDQDAVPSSRIPNFLPLQGFYLGGPLLLTVLYFRLHFLLLRLWGSIGALPAVFPDGQTPEKNGSWYLMGPIRPHLHWSRDPRSPLGLGEAVMAKLLVYWAVPVTILAFWVRYLVLQDYRGTLLHVVLFTVIVAAACGLPRIVARVLRPGDWADESTSSFLRDVLSTLRIPLAAGFLLFLFSIGVIHGLPADLSIRSEVSSGDPRRWAATVFRSVGFRPYADITEASVSDSPARDFAKETSPGDTPGPRLNEMNLRYARGYRAAFANARMWRANLEGASLSEADFRGVNLREGVLRSAKLDRLQAAKSNLVSVDGQWADLSGADFRSADMSYANFQGASLATANLTRATLYSVNLRHANLLRVDVSHADLRDAKMEDAILSLATLEQTDLSAAKLQGANFTGAQIKGTILLEADLSHADLRSAMMSGAILRQAKLDGANLDGADMRGALGLDAGQVCSAQNWRGAELDADILQAVEQRCGTQQNGAQR